jgi:hypothetical protein
MIMDMSRSMPKRIPRPHLYELAKRGAEVQLRELLEEAKVILSLFPHLRDSYDKDELPIRFIMARSSGAATRKAKRRR